MEVPHPPQFACSWCGKSREQVAVLIATPADNPPDYPHARICDECVTLFVSIAEGHRAFSRVNAATKELLGN